MLRLIIWYFYLGFPGNPDKTEKELSSQNNSLSDYIPDIQGSPSLLWTGTVFLVVSTSCGGDSAGANHEDLPNIFCEKGQMLDLKEIFTHQTTFLRALFKCFNCFLNTTEDKTPSQLNTCGHHFQLDALRVNTQSEWKIIEYYFDLVSTSVQIVSYILKDCHYILKS